MYGNRTEDLKVYKFKAKIGGDLWRLDEEGHNDNPDFSFLTA